MSRTSRRQFLGRAALASGGLVLPGLLAACGRAAEVAVTATPIGTVIPAASAAGRRGPSVGELRVAVPFKIQGLDPDASTSAGGLSAGYAEALMRFRADTTTEPWLATRVERADALTWVATLRDDVTFWDGTRLDAEAVKASFERTLAKVPSADSLIPKASVFEANGQTLTIRTPSPVPLMLKSLATTEMQIKKVAGNDILFTGPLRPREISDELMLSESYEGYRGGPPRLKTLRRRTVPDAEARMIALQAGDVDVAETLLPAHIDRIKAAGLNLIAVPTARQHMMILNPRRAPFDDVAVRQAVALGIDRNALAGVLGQGATPSYSLGPESMKIPGVVPTQKYDAGEAVKLLDAAGWKPGSDAVRSKDGKSLQFVLTTYPGRSELEQFAVIITDQLRKLGFTVTVDKVPDSNPVLNGSTFTAMMYSLGQAAFTDISRMLGYLYTPSVTNKDRYDNPQVNALFKQYLENADNPAALEALKGIQDILALDVPVVPLVVPHTIFGTAKTVKNLTIEPLAYYLYGPDVAIG